MHSHVHVHRPSRARGFGQAIRLPPLDPAPLRVYRDAEVLVDAGFGHLVRWHLSGGPWPASPSAAIGPLKGFHHAMLAPGATWPVHIHEHMWALTYVVTGALEHSDSLGNHGVLTAGGVLQRWLGWGTEHREWNSSETERVEFIQLWLAIPRVDPGLSEQQCHHATDERPGRWTQVAQSECWPSDGLMLAQDARVHVARIEPYSGPMLYRFDPGHGGYLYVIEGDVETNLDRLQTGDAARALSEGQLQVHAFHTTELMLVDVPV
jgi:quercetin 2,3-dioxygenase